MADKLVHRILSNCHIDLSDFSSAAPTSVTVATQNLIHTRKACDTTLFQAVSQAHFTLRHNKHYMFILYIYNADLPRVILIPLFRTE